MQCLLCLVVGISLIYCNGCYFMGIGRYVVKGEDDYMSNDNKSVIL